MGMGMLGEGTSQFKLSILHGFQSSSLSLEEVAALQFFRRPPVRSVSLGIFSHLLSYGVIGDPAGVLEKLYSGYLLEHST
jgi:hypothetical protein